MKLIELPNGSWIDPLTITAINVRRYKDNVTQKPCVNIIGPGDINSVIYCKDEECVDIARLIAKQVNDACNKSITEQNKEYIEKTKEVKNKKLYLALLPPQDAFLYAIKEYADLDDAFLLKSLNEIDELEDKYEGVYIHSIKNEQIVICVNDKYLTTIYSAGPKYATAIYETAKKLANK